MNRRFRSLPLILSLPVVLALSFGAYKSSAQKQHVPLIVLQSSERILDNIPFVSALASSADDRQLYILRRDTGNVTVHDRERKRTRDISSFARDPKALAIGHQGRTYIANESEVRIVDSTGQQLGAFPVPNPTSLTVSIDGNVIIASPYSEKLLQVYSGAGILLNRIGERKRFDANNSAQNNFLNSGKVIVSPSGDVYYVSIFAPIPTVQKFSSQGQLLSEFAIEGDAVNLQLEHAKEFLSTKKSSTVGGFHVITSATIDPVSGHLWVGMNGSSKHDTVSPESGVVYEYDSSGVKLSEYAFTLNPPLTPTGVITDIRDIAVNSPWIHVLTSQGQIYRFNLNDKLATDDKTRKAEPKGLLTSFVRTFWTSTPARLLTQQSSCPPEQPFTCVANCPSGSSPTTQDCAAEIKRRLSLGDRIVNNSCTINQATPGGCSGNATSCNTGTGVQVSYSVTLNCNPAPTPTPAPGGGGGGPYPIYTDPGPCGSDYYRDPSTGECVSPIIIDVAGNGFALTAAANGVRFDIKGDGTLPLLGWTTSDSDDAWLVLDRNDNGVIDNGTELFGNYTAQPASATPNGFLALGEYDKAEQGGNGDGVIDSRDAVFANLRLWQDVNHNGISESSELHTLPELGVDSISLDYKLSKKTDQYDNVFRYRAKVDDAKHAKVGRWAYDVFLVHAP